MERRPYRRSDRKSVLWEACAYLALNQSGVRRIDKATRGDVRSEVRLIDVLPENLLNLTTIKVVHDAVGVYIAEQQPEGNRSGGQVIALSVGYASYRDGYFPFVALRPDEIDDRLVRLVFIDPETGD